MTIQELQTNYGTMFVPDTDNGQYGWLMTVGVSPEDEFIEEVRKLLEERPKGCIVDVGANFGCWSMALHNAAHRVVAIEPQQVVRQLLAKSCAPYKNISIYAVAAGAEPGNTLIPVLNIDKDTNFGGISLGIPHHEQPEALMDSVQVVRGDDLLQSDRVSFIKIDVEGFEERVLLGLKNTIARCQPILFVEVDHPRTDKKKVCEWIEKMGYMLNQRGGNILAMPM